MAGNIYIAPEKHTSIVRTLYFLIYILLFVGLNACSGKPKISPVLSEAERLMNVRSDSSLLLLKGVESPEKASKEQYALWCLLITQARDKQHIEHTSDSLINMAVHYFDEADNIERRAQSYYCQGRVFTDMLLFDKAIVSYLKAEELASQTTDYNLQARICNQLGGLYEINSLYVDALIYYQKANESYKLDSYILGETYTLRDIGLAHESLGNLDSSAFYLKEALLLSERNNWDDLSRTILISLGSVYESMSLYQDAIAYIYKVIQMTNNECMLYSSYYSLGSLYGIIGQIDSASYYLDKASGSTDMYLQCQLRHEYSILRYKQKDYKAAFELNEQYITLRDSIEHRFQPNELVEIEARYNYEKLINEKYQIDLMKKNTTLFFSLIIILLLLLIIILVVVYQNKVRKKQLMIKERDHDLSESQSVIEINKALLKGKENELKLKIKELEENVTTIQSLTYENKQLEESLVQRSKELNEEIANLQSDIKNKDSLYESKLHELSLKKKELEDNEAKIKLVEIEKHRLDNLYSNEKETLNKQISELQSEIDRKESVNKELKEKAKLVVRKYLEANCPQMKRLFDKKEVIAEYSDVEWSLFEEQFSSVYPKFINKLSRHYPAMSKRELRLCCLLLLGVKTAKISAVLDLAPNTISKYSKEILKKYFISYGGRSLEDALDDMV